MKFYTQDLKLPFRIRNELKKPFGILLKGPDLEPARRASRIIKELKPKLVVAVGDVTVENLERMKLIPNVSIIDKKTKRYEKIGPSISSTGEIIHLKNPPAVIKKEAWQVLKKSFENTSPVKIVVEGEEDLLTLPAIILAPIDSVILYGQPDEGIVLVKVDEQIKNRALSIIREMEAD